MYLTLFLIFLLLSLVLIWLGFYRVEHSELSLIGFTFLFILSFVFLNGQIQYKIGSSYSYSCVCCGEYLDGERQELIFGAHNCTDTENSTLVISSVEDIYNTWDGGGTLGHFVGYWLATASAVGFAGVLWGIARTNWRKT